MLKFFNKTKLLKLIETILPCPAKKTLKFQQPYISFFGVKNLRFYKNASFQDCKILFRCSELITARM